MMTMTMATKMKLLRALIISLVLLLIVAHLSIVEREIDINGVESVFPKFTQLSVRYSPSINFVPTSPNGKGKVKNLKSVKHVFLNGRYLDPPTYAVYLVVMPILMGFVYAYNEASPATLKIHTQIAAGMFLTNTLIGFWVLKQDDKEVIGTIWYVLLTLLFNVSGVGTMLVLVNIILSGCTWAIFDAVWNVILMFFALFSKNQPDVSLINEDDIESLLRNEEPHLENPTDSTEEILQDSTEEIIHDRLKENIEDSAKEQVNWDNMDDMT